MERMYAEIYKKGQFVKPPLDTRPTLANQRRDYLVAKYG